MTATAASDLRQIGPAPGSPGSASASPKDAGDRAAVARAQRERTEEARRAAVVALLPLSRSLARRYHRGHEPLEDLEQVAAVGLLKAIDGFDLERTTPFSAYAVPTILGELRRHFRDKGWTVRVPRRLQELSRKLALNQELLTFELGRTPTSQELAQRLQTSVEAVLEARDAADAMRPVSLDGPTGQAPDADAFALIEHLGAEDVGYERVDDALMASELLGRLPDRERRILELRFSGGFTQAEIGARVGISQMHVSRLLRRSLSELERLARRPAA